jgi:hypothetical protein
MVSTLFTILQETYIFIQIINTQKLGRYPTGNESCSASGECGRI